MAEPKDTKEKTNVNDALEKKENVKEEGEIKQKKTVKKTHKKAEKATSKEIEYQKNIDEEKEKFLRLFAEFENYKKRTLKERLELFKTAGQEVILTMLPVLDDFDRAIEQLSAMEDKEVFKGINLIRNKFFEGLKSKGLEIVDVPKNVDFDSDLHEAVTQIPSPEPSMKGKIIEVLEKGYKLGDRIIRYPKVVVGQ